MSSFYLHRRDSKLIRDIPCYDVVKERHETGVIGSSTKMRSLDVHLS